MSAEYSVARTDITTYLERDIPALGISIPAMTLRRFWIMLAHYRGRIINFIIPFGVEVKYTDKPSVTRSMRSAQRDLGLDEISVVYSGKESFPLDENIQAVGLDGLDSSTVTYP